MPERFLRLQQVRERVPLSRSMIYQKIAAGEFPRPISIGSKAVAWVGSEVDAWIRERIDQHREGNR